MIRVTFMAFCSVMLYNLVHRSGSIFKVQNCHSHSTTTRRSGLSRILKTFTKLHGVTYQTAVIFTAAKDSNYAILFQRFSDHGHYKTGPYSEQVKLIFRVVRFGICVLEDVILQKYDSTC